MKKQLSFTLSEVLITLVIIGIIAAITVPIVMSNYRKAETAAKLKKFYSTVSNAVTAYEARTGTSLQESMPYARLGHPIWYDNAGGKFFKDTLNMNIVSTSDLSNQSCYNDAKNCVAYLADGTSIVLDGSFNGVNCSKDGGFEYAVGGFRFGFDVNGDKGPNKYGSDRFSFSFAGPKCPGEPITEPSFMPYGFYEM